MISLKEFQSVVKFAPLVSIDLCLVYKEKILLGMRKNEPLKGVWFTPGGRILKNEPWRDCLRRVAKTELGYHFNDPGAFSLMGVWDHFYSNSAYDSDSSTHYVNLPHYLILKEKPSFRSDSQHQELKWFDLSHVVNGTFFHEHMQTYANWLIQKGLDND